MLDIVCRAKRLDNGEWIEGTYLQGVDLYDNVVDTIVTPYYSFGGFTVHFVAGNTVVRRSARSDKHNKKIYEGDIIQFEDWYYGDVICKAVVHYGEYEQDGSSGEYSPVPCCGWYYKVSKYDLPDWLDPECYTMEEYQVMNSLSLIADKCEVIGNRYDNPELL